MKRACLLLLTLCLCGCGAIYSTGPFGEKPWNIEGEIAEWEGTWIYPDGALTVAVTDGSSGLLKVAWVEKKGGVEVTRWPVPLGTARLLGPVHPSVHLPSEKIGRSKPGG